MKTTIEIMKGKSLALFPPKVYEGYQRCDKDDPDHLEDTLPC